MAIRSGLGSQTGWGKETTYGTSVTPNKFLPTGKTDFDYVQDWQQGQGLYSGDLGPRAAQNVLTTVGATGTIEMDVQNHDMGLLFQCLMGTTVTPVQQAATTAYLQTHTLADNFGKSLTCQVGIPQQTDGVAKPYTILGGKVTTGEFTFTPGDVVKAVFTIDGQNLVETTTLASVSYTAGLAPFSIPGAGSTGLTIKTGTVGSEASITSVTQAVVTIDRKVKTDRQYLGNLGKKSEPILNEVVDTITGTLSADYYDKTLLTDLAAAGTTTSLVLEAVGANIASTYYYTFRITVPGIKITDGTPAVDGPDVINTDYPFIWVYDGTNLPKIEYMETAVTI